MRDLAAGDRVDRFLITDVVARTAMANVFKARDTAGGVPVCIKVPHPACESDVVLHQRFVREERIARRLDHPNLVRTLEAGDQSRKYIVMEYLDGTTLRQLLAGGPLEPARAAAIAIQVAQALVYLHAGGIVHRDIKPENVLVLPGDRVKLIDFGISLDRSARRLTWPRFSHGLGTPDYQAPELVGGQRGDERSDVYGLGVVLYEMLTGNLPVAADSAAAVLHLKATVDPWPPTVFVPDLDGNLSAVVCRALARRPHLRFPSAEALLAALRNPSAFPASPEERPLELPPRRPLALHVAVAAVLAALGSLTWVSHRAGSSPEPLSAEPRQP